MWCGKLFGNNSRKSRRKPLYITFDLDYLDSAVAPGVVNLEPAIEGFTMPDVLKLVQEMRGRNIIGGDVVCLMPTNDAPN